MQIPPTIFPSHLMADNFSEALKSLPFINMYANTILGNMVGGICMLSDTVLELVRIIHTKGKIMMTEPRMSAAYVMTVVVRLEFSIDFFRIVFPPVKLRN